MSTPAPAATPEAPAAASAASVAKAPTYNEIITSSPAPKPPATTPIDVPIPSSAGSAAQKSDTPVGPSRPNKTKRERAEENWKVLDNIITESEQFEKGSDARSKVLEKLHEVLRDISKKPRTGSIKKDYNSASEEWDDFLAPTCPMCLQFLDGGCCCEEHTLKHVDSFLVEDGDDEMDAAASGAGPSTAGASMAAAH
mmetsp:Transcript_12046/g.30137  ORF Transcript_12046/g.30137 Transcript_12046/m.30137 type:complete len:197 (+) Transcript_12046:223-813(+)|eukprot:CAMPEP_0173471032 /NCGR_PEP_ID=MMETSP1357-20121228/78189_1 /TAXON_ID=77926 /ORGANISM="Hemiselmis rufescens, Strain PCC563" /LENGTH=196 /DNA_ID=CAMNT_0014439333 /DNA_START=221 /DNA_END=811 /DNA_ORIENTATION=+